MKRRTYFAGYAGMGATPSVDAPGTCSFSTSAYSSSAEQVQLALKNAGAKDLKIDGKWGPCSESAYRRIFGEPLSQMSLQKNLGMYCLLYSKKEPTGSCSDGSDMVSGTTGGGGWTLPTIPGVTLPGIPGVTLPGQGDGQGGGRGDGQGGGRGGSSGGSTTSPPSVNVTLPPIPGTPGGGASTGLQVTTPPVQVAPPQINLAGAFTPLLVVGVIGAALVGGYMLLKKRQDDAVDEDMDDE